MQGKLHVILAMLVVAIFAVGCVSATENITTDIDVSADEIAVDDSVAETVDNEQIANDELADESENLGQGTKIIDLGANRTTINDAIGNYEYVLFTTGTYDQDIYNITLKNNTVVDGNGSILIGNGVDDIFLVIGCDNITIKNFYIDVNGAKHGINGSFVTNSVFYNNEIYNGKDGININKYYDNLTVEDNIIYNMENDGISLANPIINSNITTLGNTYISGNNIQTSGYGIFIGGNFKGNISANYIAWCDYGIEFSGKPNGQMSNINATIYDNTIYNVATGINIVNMTINYLKIDLNWMKISNTYQSTNYLVQYNGDNSTILGYFGFTRNSFFGRITQTLVNLTAEYDNYVNGTIVNQ